MEKVVYIDHRAEKELGKFSNIVRLKFKGLINILEKKGKLEEPFGKKFSGHEALFEARVRHKGQWRVIYTYISEQKIIFLTAFSKKSQKTPQVEIDKACKRLLEFK